VGGEASDVVDAAAGDHKAHRVTVAEGP
jgi:hypothetical protein